jgi:hypothetical protein
VTDIAPNRSIDAAGIAEAETRCSLLSFVRFAAERDELF